MDIRSNMAILAEAAALDTELNITNEASIDAARDSYDSIPVCSGITVTEASDVVISSIDNEYYVEMSNLAPFLLDSGITSIAKALDMVAEANGLHPKDVGLVIESQSNVSKMLAESAAKAKKLGKDIIRENAISKVAKNVAIAKKLMSEGYNVVKKNESAKVCKKCGKATCNCECDNAGSGATTGTAAISECDDKKK